MKNILKEKCVSLTHFSFYGSLNIYPFLLKQFKMFVSNKFNSLDLSGCLSLKEQIIPHLSDSLTQLLIEDVPVSLSLLENLYNFQNLKTLGLKSVAGIYFILFYLLFIFYFILFLFLYHFYFIYFYFYFDFIFILFLFYFYFYHFYLILFFVIR